VRIKDERGSSMIDFLGFGLLLQVPVLLLATQLATIHANQLAADSIARHSLRSLSCRTLQWHGLPGRFQRISA